MGLVETVRVAMIEELDRVANTIQGELKAACPKRSGQAAASVHTEHMGEYVRFVGSDNLHFFFADQGNNQSVRTIYPVRAKALRFTDGSFHASAGTYEGKHFVKEVADRHR